MNSAIKLQEYKEYLKQSELSEGTISVYFRYARRLVRYMDGRKIDKQEMLIYKKSLGEKYNKVSTINLCIVATNKFLKFAGYENCILKTEKLQRKQSLDHLLEQAEYKKMLSFAKFRRSGKYYYIMKTLAYTGIRVSELCFFTVEALESGRTTVRNKGKTREVYIPDKLIAELKQYCKQQLISTGVIFRGNTNKPITRSAIYKGLIYIAKWTGIPKEKAHPHNFRHMFALMYMKQYSNLPELADILGHSSLETTRIYTTTTAEEKRSRMNNLGF